MAVHSCSIRCRMLRHICTASSKFSYRTGSKRHVHAFQTISQTEGTSWHPAVQQQCWGCSAPCRRSHMPQVPCNSARCISHSALECMYQLQWCTVYDTENQRTRSSSLCVMYADDPPKLTGLSVQQMMDRVRTDFQEKQYYVTGNFSPELFTDECVRCKCKSCSDHTECCFAKVPASARVSWHCQLTCSSCVCAAACSSTQQSKCEVRLHR